MFPDELRVSWFLDRFPHYSWTAAVSPFRLHWVKDACVFSCNLPPALWQNDWDPLRAAAITRVGTDTEQESARKVNFGKEHSPAAPAGTRTRDLSITSPTLIFL